MKFIADLHIHSYLSRATSRECDLPHLHQWAQRKGLTVVGTGDFTHPEWFRRICEELVPAEPGLFQLRDDLARRVDAEVPKGCAGPVRFMLQVEISNIYKRDGRTRKVHNVVFMPDLQAVERFNTALGRLGNIKSDGRPILGLDSRDLLEMVLEASDTSFLIPAHIWTPWFSVLGSKSGFDSIKECYADLTPHIFAVETGLSSDPAMNWRLSQLDGLTLVSNSDAHSPSKLAREANLFHCELSYPAMLEALRTGKGFGGTVEFYPEEGKYHFDGHRKCGARMTPRETLDAKGICPVCGRKVTVGVLHRVEALADRPEGGRPEQFHPYASLIGLAEIIGQARNKGPATKGVTAAYRRMLAELGPELAILREVPLEDIERRTDPVTAEGIRRVRTGELHIASGFDGEFGTISLFAPGERDSLTGQSTLFAIPEHKPRQKRRPEAKEPETYSPDGPLFAGLKRAAEKAEPYVSSDEQGRALVGLTDEQRQAVLHPAGPISIIAGPGTGKTRTLTCRIAHRIETGELDPAHVLAVTFTNKAAAQMKERLGALLSRRTAAAVTVSTFHRLGLDLLRRYAEEAQLDTDREFDICDREQAESLMALACPQLAARARADALNRFSKLKSDGHDLMNLPDAQVQALGPELNRAALQYGSALSNASMVDLDDLIALPCRLLEHNERVRDEVRTRFRAVFVDEYQDLNPLQERLLEFMAPPDADITVIGDPDQAIYTFRGADPQAIARFAKRRPGAVHVVLHQSFRTPDLILEAASRVTSVPTGPHKPPGRVWSQISGRGPIPLHVMPTEKAEAEFVVCTLEQMVGGTGFFSMDSGRVGSDQGEPDRALSFGDVAVLFRLAAQLPALEEAFDRSGIPYRTAAPNRELGNESRLALAVLKLARQPKSRLDRHAAFRAALAVPSFVPSDKKPGARKLVAFADPSVPAARLPEFLGRVTDAAARLADDPGIDASAEDLVKQTVDLLWPDRSPFEHETVLGELQPPPGSDLTLFLNTVVLRSPQDRFDPRAEKVHLMTLHAAKGLEFPVVFLAGCNDGILPYRPPKGECLLSEERRLFYVGMTRASSTLILSAAAKRRLFGKTLQGGVTPFIRELEERLCQKQEGGLPRRKRKRKEGRQLDLL